MDETTAETAARLRRVVMRLNRKLRMSSLGGVSPAQASMLASINKYERPSLGDLAVAEQIQPPSVTRLVRDMEKAGLVTCTLDENDRRCTRVALSPLGRKELATVRLKREQFIERKLKTMSAEDQSRARDAAAILETLLGFE